MKSPGLSGQGQLSGSLCPSPGASLLLSSDAPCPSSASGWTVSLLSMPPLLQDPAWLPRPQRTVEGFHSPGEHRGIFSLASSFFQMLPEPCRCTALHRGQGPELRLEGHGQWPRAPKQEHSRRGTKGKVQISADRILKV